jgi:hypothetical protein
MCPIRRHTHQPLLPDFVLDVACRDALLTPDVFWGDSEACSVLKRSKKRAKESTPGSVRE